MLIIVSERTKGQFFSLSVLNWKQPNDKFSLHISVNIIYQPESKINQVSVCEINKITVITLIPHISVSRLTSTSREQIPARFGVYNNMRQTHSFHFKQFSVKYLLSLKLSKMFLCMSGLPLERGWLTAKQWPKPSVEHTVVVNGRQRQDHFTKTACRNS